MPDPELITVLSGSKAHLYSSSLLSTSTSAEHLFPPKIFQSEKKEAQYKMKSYPLVYHPLNCIISPKHQLYNFLIPLPPSSLNINFLRVFFLVFSIYYKSQLIESSFLSLFIISYDSLLWYPLHMCPCVSVFIHSFVQSVNINWVPYELSTEKMMVNMMDIVLVFMEFIV